MTLFLIGIFIPPLYPQESEFDKLTLLINQVDELNRQGRYAEAIPIAEQIVEIKEKSFGPDHPDIVTPLGWLAFLYQNAGDYKKAESVYKRAIAICETYKQTMGQDHPGMATLLKNLSWIYRKHGKDTKADTIYTKGLEIEFKILDRLAKLMEQRRYSELIPIAEKALRDMEKKFGPEHPYVEDILDCLGFAYYELGKSIKAKPFYERSLAIKEKTLDPYHPDLGLILSSLSRVYLDLNDYAKAETLNKRALEIIEKNLGPDHPNVAAELRWSAQLYSEIGDYTKAALLNKRALSIYKKVHGPESSKVAETLEGIAFIYEDRGDYTSAERLHNKSLAIMEKIHGPEHPKINPNLYSLGSFYQSLGYYKKAESLYKRALMIAEKAFGQEHLDVAFSLGKLAFVYRLLGENVKAKNLYEKELNIKKKMLGPEHPEVASALCLLADVYKNIGDYSKAESLYKKALDIREKAFGRYHLYVRVSVGQLGIFYLSLGDYKKAEMLFKRAIAIDEKLYGSMHPLVAEDLALLATVYRYTGNYANAESLYKRALAIMEKTLGPDHPKVASMLNFFASFYVIRHNFKKAHELQKQALQIDDKIIEQIMGFTSEDEKIKYLSAKRGNLDSFLQLVSRRLSQDASVRRNALDVWLKRKGIILEALKRFQEALIYTDNPRAVKTFQDLSRVRSRISKLTFSDPGKEEREAYKKKIADLEAQKDKLEAQLSKLSWPFALKKKIAAADCEKVAKALPENTVLIEFARIGALDLKTKDKKDGLLPARYLAFVLPSGNGNNVGMIDLGNADIIDKAVSEFKKELAGVKNPQDAKAIISSGDIYKLVFQPLRKELGDMREIFISPDGNLNLIPFEILQGPDGRYLIEDYTFNYLSVGRDVLGFGQIEDKGKKALLIGDPDFDMGTDEKNVTLKKLALYKADQKTIRKRSLDMSVFHFKRLPGTRQEVNAIQTLLGKENVWTYTGGDALEEVLKKSETPTILHLATHGFFLKDQEVRNLPGDPAMRGFYSYSTSTINQLPKIKIENPMLRSGFALAGANKALAGIDETVDDGIVTSEEILGLRLRGTDMVVLSACYTGVGEVKTGEGVFGLRRAFAQAGAKSLIMSLWAVPDKETRELMVQFYKNIMTGQMNRCQALRQAALKQMKIVKKRYGHTHPYFWGGFVMVGDPGQQPVNRKLH